MKAVIVGATGYSGRELARILIRHPRVEIVCLFSSPQTKGSTAKTLDSFDPDELRSLSKTRHPLRPFDEKELIRAAPEVVFFATPNETSNEVIPHLRAQPFKIVDLSGSFRLADASAYPQWYGFSHAAPDLLPRFVYGLPELNRHQITAAQWIANPGCYATSALLPLLPLAKGGWIDESSPVICDSKSGVSGAGKQPTPNTHFCEVSESFKAYSVFSHRHLPEMQHHLGLNGTHPLIFTPHLLPINRGILSTLYVKTKKRFSSEVLTEELLRFYADAPFVRILSGGELPQVKWVTHTNFCDLGLRVDADSNWIVMVSCLDNLMKGAAGQAVQNMNLMFGLEECAGLE